MHPDICVSEVMAGLGGDLERTFVRLWTHCDDEGRCVDNPKLIKAAIYPLHDAITATRVDKDLGALQAAGLILRYTVGGTRVVAVSSWGEYQHPQRATASKLPPFDGSGVVREPSASVQRALHAGVGEGEGEEEGGGEGTVDRASTVRVFMAWVEATGRDAARTKLTTERRRRITHALKDYSLDDVVDAVQGVSRSPFHCGQNDRHRRYDDLDLVLKNGAKIEEFRDLWRNLRPVPAYDRALMAVSEDRDRRTV